MTYTREDISQAMNLSDRRTRYTLLVVAIVVLIIAIGIFSVNSDLALVLIGLVVGGIIGYQIRRIRYINGTLKSPGFQGEKFVQISEDLLFVRSMVSETKLHRLHKVASSKKALLLYFSHFSFLVVPRRVCTDDAQYARLLALGQRLAAKAPPPPSSTPPSETTERNA